MDIATLDLETLPTPCLLLDRGKLENNARRMRERIAGLHASEAQ